jgi:VWFA-related protein
VSLELLPAIFCSSFALALVPCFLGQQLQQSTPVVRSFTNEVLVPVVVRDAQGHAVGDLAENDFQVFDNGKQQTITSFRIIKRATGTSAPNPSAPSQNATDSHAVSQPSALSQRFVFFLFDDYNLTYADLPNAQQAAIKALDSSLGPADMAAVPGAPRSAVWYVGLGVPGFLILIWR